MALSSLSHGGDTPLIKLRRRSTTTGRPYVDQTEYPPEQFTKSDSIDERSGFTLFYWAQESTPLLWAAKLANTVVDDPVYIIGLAVGWLGSLLARHLGWIPADSCVPEAFNEFYFCFMMWSATESMIKLLTAKRRPAYGNARASEVTGVLIPGDQHSFPSGHTLRAFGTARILYNNPVIAAGFGTESILGSEQGSGAMILLWGAAVVGWSRVALGKHSPVDVLAGMGLGLIFGEPFFDLRLLTPTTRWLFQMFCLAYYTFIGAFSVLGLLGAPPWLTFREFWGFKSKVQQFLFVLLPLGGSWIFALGRTQHPDYVMPTLYDLEGVYEMERVDV